MSRVEENDTRTISDSVALLLGETVHDSRGREIGRPREYATNRVRVDLWRREIYSYGTHFPLFRFIPKEGRRAPLFLVNGDEWRGNNSRTNAHQSATREAIARHGADSLIVPFSALNGAGIDLDSVRPIHVRADSNWTETRYAETMAGVPRHERTIRYSVDCEATTLERVPEKYRRAYRELTDAEIVARDAELEADGAYIERMRISAHSRYQNADVLPDADGIYRWSEGRTRTRERDADGRYSWTVNVHRLGDALFSGVRAIREPMRDARPFESERDNARETVSLTDADGSHSCGRHFEGRRHEAGPSSACIHCGSVLRASVVWHRRARYLSSFDTNESPSQYFLVEVPHGAGNTVESALDALAPRAVHAAIARGRNVARQGDVFFIDTPLTDADLHARGIKSRARLTQSTRTARARAGETGYAAPLTRDERRRMDEWTAREWRHIFRDAVGHATAREGMSSTAREILREESRARWNELRARHESERASAGHAGADPSAPLSSACEHCDALPGAPCVPIATGNEFLDNRIEYDREANGGFHAKRVPLERRHESERDALRRETERRRSDHPGAPLTDAGARARWRAEREGDTRELFLAEGKLTSAIFAGPIKRYNGARAYRYADESQTQADRREHAHIVSSARERVDTIRARHLRNLNGANGRPEARDAYRKRYGENALAAWRNARHAARLRFDRTYDSGARWDRDRAAITRALSIYGTAHSAREVITLRSGAVYVRGTVSHRPELIGDQWRAPEHRPILLGDGNRWYLAVRNTVPRQTVRRRNRRKGSASQTRVR